VDCNPIRYISCDVLQNDTGDNSPLRRRIGNHSQIRDDFNHCGFSASKLWNVGRYHIQQQWDEDNEIPDEAKSK
jgi:hypothetical protein